MNDITLTQAEALHRLIGDACIAVGLRSRYLGALAYRVGKGASEDVQAATWAVVRANPDDLEVGGLEPVGEELFRIAVGSPQASAAADSWDMVVQGKSISLSVIGITDRGQACLDSFKAQLGAD